MNYAFIIDNRKCIGCHACTTACKSENQVPLGVFRTWVKYVEVGRYPHVRRYFQVTRCNHCANPPCVRICPVTAMYQRTDGIVEFDPAICIGCKACMQACPYDAIYIDPETHTAAKCHFCAHRVDMGLEPACVIVCPEHAIIAGDLDDPNSEVSRILATTQVVVRKPEQGTAPKLFYIEGNDAALHPTVMSAPPPTWAFADVPSSEDMSAAPPPQNAGNGELARETLSTTAFAGTPIRPPDTQGHPTPGPIYVGRGRMAENMVQVAYNVTHAIPWHWPVPAYLVTKGISSGAFMLFALGLGLGLFPFSSLTAVAVGILTLLFIGLTTVFLIVDLERPERFLYIVLRPQWHSWLARGAFLLLGFSAVIGLWWVLETGAFLGWLPDTWAASVRTPAVVIGGLLALGAAVYTAFLFGQAEGRDLWQNNVLPVHLIVQAFLAGSAAYLVLAPVIDWGAEVTTLARWTFGVALVVDLLIIFLGEVAMPHATEVAAQAAHDIRHGAFKHHFWGGAIVLGHLLPLAFLMLGHPLLLVLAGIAALGGLYLFEYAFVMAPQRIPNS